MSEISLSLEERKRAFFEPLVAALVVTGVVMVVAYFVPASYVAVGVALVFLAATWFFVFRHSDDVVLRSGLGLGGLVARARVGSDSSESPLSNSTADLGEMIFAALRAVGVAAALAVLIFVPFYVGFLHWWKPIHGFSLHVRSSEMLSIGAGQLFVIALPEEAFYRGYMQSRLDVAFPSRVRILGADVGLSIVVTSVVFALGHLATVHHATRLAVFFPSLLFGFLRARTGGIGAGVAFHAMCNVYSEMLGRGFGVY